MEKKIKWVYQMVMLEIYSIFDWFRWNDLIYKIGIDITELKAKKSQMSF